MNQKKKVTRLSKAMERETKSDYWRAKRINKIVRESKVPEIFRVEFHI